jgi:N-methylhydantoinase A
VGWTEIPIFERNTLAVESRIPGPCIVEEQISTTLIPEDFVAIIDEYRNIIIRSVEHRAESQPSGS